jgi:tRNA-2-methylthio-N6-dimethylallyladenosine synthase
MNVYDADRLRTVFVERGWTETSQEEAQVLVFLTCSIRDKAEQKVWSELGRIGAGRKKRKHPFVVVAGCMAARVGERMARRFPWVRVVVGPRHLGDLPNALEKSLADGALRLLLDEDPREVRDLCVPPKRRDNPGKGLSPSRTAATTIVPTVLSLCARAFSVPPPGEILDEIQALVDDGVKEIRFSDKTSTAMAPTMSQRVWTFARLLRRAARLSGVKRLRFATNHPMDLTDEVIAVMAEEPAVARPSIFLSGGKRSRLALMNRGYSVGNTLFSLLNSEAPRCSGDHQRSHRGVSRRARGGFRASCACLKRFRFDMVHTAAYSIREGTRAASMEGLSRRR